jgi:hypothetical protein
MSSKKPMVLIIGATGQTGLRERIKSHQSIKPRFAGPVSFHGLGGRFRFISFTCLVPRTYVKTGGSVK